MTLSEGTTVPSVSAQNQDGEPCTPSFEEPTVLYFYPRDDTPGCTREATEFDDHLDAFEDAGVTIYGVSTDDVQSHSAFAEKHGLGFDLLADPEGEVADAFDVDRSFQNAVTRTTYLIQGGTVRRVYESVDPAGHPEELLADIRDDGPSQA